MSERISLLNPPLAATSVGETVSLLNPIPARLRLLTDRSDSRDISVLRRRNREQVPERNAVAAR